MAGEITKAQEIKRLTTPLKFKDSKAYDCEGNLIKCVETLSDVRFIIEPRDGILSDEEIAGVQEIHLFNLPFGATSFKGFEHFTALKRLIGFSYFPDNEFNYTAFKETYGLDCDIDDAHWLMMRIEIDGVEGLMTPMIGDIADTSTGDYVLKLPLDSRRTLKDISFRVKGKLNTEIRVSPR